MNIDDHQKNVGLSPTDASRQDWLCLPAGFFSIQAETIFIDAIQSEWVGLRELGFRPLRDSTGSNVVAESNLVQIDLHSASRATIVSGDRLSESAPVIASGRLAGRSPGFWHRSVRTRDRVIVVVGPRVALSSEAEQAFTARPGQQYETWVASVPVLESAA